MCFLLCRGSAVFDCFSLLLLYLPTFNSAQCSGVTLAFVSVIQWHHQELKPICPNAKRKYLLSVCLAEIRFPVICDYKIVKWFQSGWAKHHNLTDSLNKDVASVFGSRLNKTPPPQLQPLPWNKETICRIFPPSRKPTGLSYPSWLRWILI